MILISPDVTLLGINLTREVDEGHMSSLKLSLMLWGQNHCGMIMGLLMELWYEHLKPQGYSGY